MKKLLPQEIMFDDCPACGMPINKNFVQSILQEVWNKALDTLDQKITIHTGKFKQRDDYANNIPLSAIDNIIKGLKF